MRLIATLMLGLLWAAGLPAAALAAAESPPAAAQTDASGRSGAMVESRAGFWTLSPNPGDPTPASPSVVTGRIDCTGPTPPAGCPPAAAYQPPPEPGYTEAYAYPEEPDWAELPWSFEIVPVIVVERPFHPRFRLRRHFAHGFGHRVAGGFGHPVPGFAHSTVSAPGSLFGSFR